MIAYNHPNALEGEIYIGFYPKAFFEMMLWQKKRQDEGDCGPRTMHHNEMTFATFLDRQEVLDRGILIVEDGGLSVESSDSSDENADRPPEGLASA